jgi:hypothetical protein
MNNYIFIGLAVWITGAVVAAGIYMRLEHRSGIEDAVDSLVFCLLWPFLLAALPVIGLVGLLSYAVVGVSILVDRLMR